MARFFTVQRANRDQISGTRDERRDTRIMRYVRDVYFVSACILITLLLPLYCGLCALRPGVDKAGGDGSETEMGPAGMLACQCDSVRRYADRTLKPDSV